jgi:EAL and modified HD-GYP domain-containing signal transduction protein
LIHDTQSDPAKEQPAHTASPVLPGQRFLARQPILDRSMNVFGYELLFRTGIENFFNADPEHASHSAVDTLLLGINTFCGKRFAFVNCTLDVLLQDIVTLLPPHQTVVEILETVEPDPRVVAACRRLKAAGYQIALDDFAPDDTRLCLCEFADIIKIDIRATSPDQRADMLRSLQSPHCRMLAEKVETRAEYQQARDMGFHYFQGYFFCRPEIVSSNQVPASRLNYVRLLEIISRRELNVDELEHMLKQEPSISYRLLRYLNSPLFGLTLEIKSLRQAIVILGEQEMRRWVRLIVTVCMAEQSCSELVLMGLIRARFCELLFREIRPDIDLFLMGLLSLMDAILEVKMDALLQELPVDREIKAALLGHKGNLRPMYEMMLAQESGDLAQSNQIARKLGLAEEAVVSAWWQAIQWAQQATSLA